MHLPLLQKPWRSDGLILFKQHPSDNSSPSSLPALSSTRSSSPSVSAACWSPSWPWRCTLWWCRTGSYQAKAAGSSLWGQRGASIRNRRISDQTTASPSDATTQMFWPFIFSCSTNFVIWWALNYSCKHKLVKSGFRKRTSCLWSGNVEDTVASQQLLISLQESLSHASRRTAKVLRNSRQQLES